jgi:hypothetical protein
MHSLGGAYNIILLEDNMRNKQSVVRSKSDDVESPRESSDSRNSFISFDDDIRKPLIDNWYSNRNKNTTMSKVVYISVAVLVIGTFFYICIL